MQAGPFSVNEKSEVLERDFAIQTTRDLEGRLNVMCNLSEAIREDAMAIGVAKGRAEGRAEARAESRLNVAVELYRDGSIPVERAAKIAEMTVQDFLDTISRTDEAGTQS